MNRAVLLCTLGFLLMPGGHGPVRAEIPAQPDLDKGKALYQNSCQRCHGVDGDATDYYGIVPLAGYARRPPVGFVGLFQKSSFSIRGEQFEGEEARSLVAYLSLLRGAKGFPDPGWLYSTYLVDKKRDFLSSCRIVDVRSEDAYREGHIPNAFPWGLASSGLTNVSRDSLARRLGELGVTPATQIVIYDEQSGEGAAQVWWLIRQTGHPYVAVLDGGWSGWLDLGYRVSTTTPSLRTTEFRDTSDKKRAITEEPRHKITLGRHTDGGTDITIDCAQMRNRRGLIQADEMFAYLKTQGLEPGFVYSFEDQAKDVYFLAFVLTLLGYDPVELDPDSARLRF